MRCIGKGAELLKKAGGINLTQLKNSKKAEVIDAMRPMYRLKDLLKLFKISKSSYFYNIQAASHGKYEDVRKQLHAVFASVDRCYGYQRIHAVLTHSGIVVSEKVIRRLMKEGEQLVVHSDRGAHYRWPGWIDRMNEAGLTRSMPKKGCSPDNSACEGFFGRLKNEMFYGRSWRDASIEEFISRLDGYIRWYNNDRIKESLGWMSPVEYRQSLGLAG